MVPKLFNQDEMILFIAKSDRNRTDAWVSVHSPSSGRGLRGGRILIGLKWAFLPSPNLPLLEGGDRTVTRRDAIRSKKIW
jgi:hypothetical protein